MATRRWILATVPQAVCASVYKRYSINTHQRDISAVCRWVAGCRMGQDTRTRYEHVHVDRPNCLAFWQDSAPLQSIQLSITAHLPDVLFSSSINRGHKSTSSVRLIINRHFLCRSRTFKRINIKRCRIPAAFLWQRENLMRLWL